MTFKNIFLKEKGVVFLMKTTKRRRKPNYKHFAEVFSVIALIIFANRVHMLDGSTDPKWWGWFLLVSLSVLAIIGIENISNLVAIIKAAYIEKMADIAAEKQALERRSHIQCYVCNTKITRTRPSK